MPRRIEIDDDLYRYLESKARGFETPNDVIRRELHMQAMPSGRTPAVTPSDAVGALADLIAEGLVQPGDQLQHVQPRRRRRFEGNVEADGRIRTVEGVYAKPSPALSAMTGGSINGWDAWVHRPSGKTLNQLKAECERLVDGRR